MTSPFPGMDPYMESHWRDVHARLVHNACNAIQRQLGSDLRARIEERLVVEWESEEVTETFVQIIDVSTGGQLVTIIEFLSPTNKILGDGKNKYRQKQQEVIDAGINLIEIDLVKEGKRELLYPVARLPPEYQTTYLTCVRRGFSVAHYEIYRMPLRERLPAIRIPLRDTDPDAVLDIQKLVDMAYDEGRYDDIDYRKPCNPPIDEADAAWADELLRAAGRR